uniref:cytochrome c oxidase subunit II n=1 Tax=Mooreobdella quaternaria TaxID=3027019 RepID=UPI0023D80051|nr:cytochrome c oxidase subunit II [Mooreobdella quaternaria]WDA96112.1 cytochrome c oxidase subunit II [Mooreobdella quaternaria]
MMYWMQNDMQDPITSVMADLIKFHDFMLVVMILVLSIIGYALLAINYSGHSNRYIFEAQEIETFWTIAPAFILVSIALPSIQLLYAMDEMFSPAITIKAMGHQWYWSYEYGDFNNISFDSYMIPTEQLSLGDYRLLEVDNRLVVPMNMEIRMIVSAADVIHSWAVPSLGVKMDAIPGRLNQMSFYVKAPGVYYGQCSEICGINHSFMPISMEVINMKDFIQWMKKQ